MAENIRYLTVIITVLAAVFAITVGLLMAIGIGKAIRNIVEGFNRAAEGDLTVSYPEEEGRVHVLAKAFNRMLEHMRSMIGNISESAMNVNESAGTIAVTSRRPLRLPVSSRKPWRKSPLEPRTRLVRRNSAIRKWTIWERGSMLFRVCRGNRRFTAETAHLTAGSIKDEEP